MATDYQIILDQVSSRAPGAIQKVIELELAAVLLDFLDTTNAWVAGIPVSTISGTTTYIMAMPLDGVPTRLMNCIDAVSLLPVKTYYVPDNNQLVLLLAPSVSGALVANVALIPDVANPLVLPNWLWAKYRNGFVDGTLARMFSQLGKPYTAPPLAKQHYALYTDVRSQAKYEAMHAYNYRGQAWRFPKFAGTRSQRR